MRNPFLIITSLIFGSTIFISCNNILDKEKVDTTDFNVLVQTWNKAHSSKDVGVFSILYDDKVLYYGTSLGKNFCIESKLTLFKKYPDFYQQIYGGIQIDTLSSTEYKISFVKRVTINKISSDYPSYLTFKKIDSNWKIVTEGDLVTDKNLSIKGNVKDNKTNRQDFNYEPIVSTISGTLKVETYFGPPGYGENPQTDSREDSYILILDNSINVISNDDDIEEGEYNVTKFNISKVQLAADPKFNLRDYKNRVVRVSGRFFGAHTGHHHTQVLLFVTGLDTEVVFD